MIKLILKLVTLLFSAIGDCGSATISVRNLEKSDTKIVLLSGQIYASDAQDFQKITHDLPTALVILDSPGGSVTSSVTIGRSINRKGYVTVVPPETFCVSSCALIWLAGSQRFAEKSSFLGFHAAYIRKDGKAVVSRGANAFIGTYLRELGLSETTAAYITSAPPDSVSWLSIETARSMGIKYFTVNKQYDGPPTN